MHRAVPGWTRAAIFAARADRQIRPATITLCSLLFASLALNRLGSKSLWLDEAVSVLVARLDGKALLAYVTTAEPNIGFYYLALHLWLALGDSESVIRGLSVLAAIGTMPISYLLGERLFGRTMAATATVLLALNAFFVAYAQEARSYALVVLLVTAASYVFVRAVQDPLPGRWALYVTLAVVAVYMHLFAAFVLVAHAFSLFFLPRRDVPIRSAVAAYGAIGVLVLPLAWAVLHVGIGRIAWIDRPTLAGVVEAFSDLAGRGGRSLLAAYFVAGCLFLAAAIRIWRAAGTGTASWPFAFTLMWLFVPIVLSLAISMVQPVFLPSYLIVSLPSLVMVAAVGLRSAPRRWLQVVLLLLIVLLAARGVVRWYAADKEGWREATALVLADGQAGDGIAFFAPYVVQPFGYYAQRRVATLPRCK